LDSLIDGSYEENAAAGNTALKGKDSVSEREVGSFLLQPSWWLAGGARISSPIAGNCPTFDFSITFANSDGDRSQPIAKSDRCIQWYLGPVQPGQVFASTVTLSHQSK